MKGSLRQSTICLVVLVGTSVFVPPRCGACNGSEPPLRPSAVVGSSQADSPFIVIGFLGGFVSHDEPHHPEVQMIRGLRQEYPAHAYFGLFENRRIGEAYRTILRLLGAKEGRNLSDADKRQARIVLFGHSWGASAVVVLSRKLARVSIPVMLTIQVDSVAKPFQNDHVIPSNVLQAANFYQTRGLIRGRAKIIPADPSRTTILGNFRLGYKEEPSECRDFSWAARMFTKSHIAIECDPKVWSEVRTLILSHLANTVVTQTDTNEVRLPRKSPWSNTAITSVRNAETPIPSSSKFREKFGKRLRLVFRNFPLGEMHPHAEAAAEVAEFAGARGKFWEMHDRLFENQARLGDEHFDLQT